MNAGASWTAVTSGAIHRFRFGVSESPREFRTTSFEFKRGNCACLRSEATARKAGSIAALRNLAEDLTDPNYDLNRF